MPVVIPTFQRNGESDYRARDLAAAIQWFDYHSPPRIAGMLQGHGWRWDDQTQTYISDTGTALDEDDRRAIVFALILACELECETYTQNLVANNMTLANWGEAMERSITNEQLSLAMLGVGGEINLSPQDWRIIIGRKSTEDEPGLGITDAAAQLKNFAGDISDGKAGTRKQVVFRSGQYSDGGYAVYEQSRGASHGRVIGSDGKRLFTLERNILDVAVEKHCLDTEYTEGCISVSEAGWRPIGTLPRPGERTCGPSCRCHFEYRGDETEE